MEDKNNIWKNISHLNSEIGIVKTDIGWIKQATENCDKRMCHLTNRMWWILGSVVAFGITSIYLAVI